jgi:hypothetical protein
LRSRGVWVSVFLYVFIHCVSTCIIVCLFVHNCRNTILLYTYTQANFHAYTCMLVLLCTVARAREISHLRMYVHTQFAQAWVHIYYTRVCIGAHNKPWCVILAYACVHALIQTHTHNCTRVMLTYLPASQPWKYVPLYASIQECICMFVDGVGRGWGKVWLDVACVLCLLVYLCVSIYNLWYMCVLDSAHSRWKCTHGMNGVRMYRDGGISCNCI